MHHKFDMKHLLVTARETFRPSMELVIRTIREEFDRLSISVRLEHDGPDYWMWRDLQFDGEGLDKFYIVSGSTSEGVEGYPILTVRQAYSKLLDTWITFTSLITGPEEAGIRRSITMAIVNHSAAFAGIRTSNAFMHAAAGEPAAGLAAVEAIIKLDPAHSAFSLENAVTELPGGYDPESN